MVNLSKRSTNATNSVNAVRRANVDASKGAYRADVDHGVSGGREWRPDEAIRIPLDYAPRLHQLDESRRVRRERWVNHITFTFTFTFTLVSFLMWSVILLSAIGVYISRVDGWERGWVFLALAVGSLCLLVCGYVFSDRVRKILRGEE